MTKKEMGVRVVVIAAIFGPMILLSIGFTYDILSPRALAISIVAWFVTVLVVAFVRGLVIKKMLAGGASAAIVIDERTRRRIVRGIRVNKI